ncbi:MAG TPA: DNRLRE domain-containing protein [Vicinamibacterales bacterium]|jgi:endonuclease/exonuclease/phosphatase family metal-dependent hydrolase|nr:DNRLRE domain-containing protein [Vicinamibacterales bacterium]
MFGVVVFAASVSAVAAQTTVTLNQSRPQVVYATLRAGAYANTNYPTVLTTRAADTADNHRRALLKFDTQNTIPAGSAVTSALLTVTVKSGGATTPRTIGAYQVTTSWAETETTWNRRRTTAEWMTHGGDLGSLIAQWDVSNVAGTKVTFDVTPLVKQAVSGALGSSRYTRMALVDLDPASGDSTRNFYTPDESNSALRPTLKVVYGGTTTTAGSTTTLRVLDWNTHHGGVGTDGKLDADRLIKKAASFKPDIVSFNEVERYTGWGNYDGPAVMAALMKKYTGLTWYYKFATATGAATGNGNLILSRFPFAATDVQLLSHNRSAVNATINVNGRSINFFSTHLDADSTSYRLQEIGELTSWAKGIAEQRIIAGDFNAWPGSTENKTMTITYVDSWAQAQTDGTAVAYSANTAGNTRNSRIDYIYYSKGATALKLVSSQVFDVRDANGVMPSDHRPVLSVFTVK